jgi:predicted Zn finger-like uncharacterized protein
MAIRVTCPGCHTRFNVSEKFAGKEGPCPKCKKVIKVPERSEEVKIHAPESFGPKDKAGRATIKPVFRKETKVTPIGITIVTVAIVGFLLFALISRIATNNGANCPVWLVALGAVALAIPCCYAGYTFLRNQEGGAYVGKELWMRVGICAAIYAALWIAMPIAKIAFIDYGLGAWLVATLLMAGIGAAVCMYTLELDYLVGLLHYGLYFGCCLIMRVAAGIGVFPGMVESGSTDVTPAEISPTGDGEGGMSLLLDQLRDLFC